MVQKCTELPALKAHGTRVARRDQGTTHLFIIIITIYDNLVDSLIHQDTLSTRNL